jgi:carboxypeptidase PM20D1
MYLILVPLALLIFLVAWMLFQTLKLQRVPDEVEPAPKAPIDSSQVSKHLSQAIRIKTISKMEMSEGDRKPFLELHDWINNSFPLINEKLNRTVVNEYSLLYTWAGTDSHLKPVLLNAHMDVVPVDEVTRKEWKSEPFGGEIRDGFIWGRGALDMKGIMVGLLESVEALLKEGYTPQRTIYLSFGHDEEIMGYKGSLKIMEHLKAKGVQLAAVLDEGGIMSLGSLPVADSPIAFIGNAEKGFLTMKLSAEGKPGHSSRPPRQTAIGIISRAIAIMDDNPMPYRLNHFLPTLKGIGYMLPFNLQFILANEWLLKGLMIRKLKSNSETAALLHTTNAATMIEGGIKDNVLPSSATAKVNLRLMPGDTIEGAFAHFRKVVNDPRLKMELDLQTGGWEASAISSTDTPAFRTLELVVRQTFNNVPTAPFIFLAATDSRHYQPICANIFKFSPYFVKPEEQKGIHGINERISQDTLAGMAAFYYRLMKVWGDAGF